MWWNFFFIFSHILELTGFLSSHTACCLWERKEKKTSETRFTDRNKKWREICIHLKSSDVMWCDSLYIRVCTSLPEYKRRRREWKSSIFMIIISFTSSYITSQNIFKAGKCECERVCSFFILTIALIHENVSRLLLISCITKSQNLFQPTRLLA
jgi:hypothetical protein